MKSQFLLGVFILTQLAVASNAEGIRYCNGQLASVYNGTRYVPVYPNGQHALIYNGTRYIPVYPDGKHVLTYNGTRYIPVYPNGQRALVYNGSRYIYNHPNGNAALTYNGSRYVPRYPNGVGMYSYNGSRYVPVYPNGQKALVYNGSHYVIRYPNGGELGACGENSSCPDILQFRYRDSDYAWELEMDSRSKELLTYSYETRSGRNLVKTTMRQPQEDNSFLDLIELESYSNGLTSTYSISRMGSDSDFSIQAIFAYCE